MKGTQIGSVPRPGVWPAACNFAMRGPRSANTASAQEARIWLGTLAPQAAADYLSGLVIDRLA